MTAAAAKKPAAPAPRPRILCVDDEAHILEGIRDVLWRSFEVHVATSGLEGLKILSAERDAFAVVISDMRMPKMGGDAFLREAGVIAPDTVPMLLTGQPDVESAIKIVNAARLFRFLTKPCEPAELMQACAAALSQHRLKRAERELLEQTLHGSIDALTEVLALAKPAAFGRGHRVKELAGALARKSGIANWWEVEVAAMLAQVGSVTLPQMTAEKLYAGIPLSRHEAAMAERVPAVTLQLLSRIPRLEGVLEILDRYREPTDEGVGSSGPLPLSAQVLKIASDYLELEAQGSTPALALGAMRTRGAYEPQLMERFAEMVGVDSELRVYEIPAADLRVGMTLAADVRSDRGALLIAGGQRITERMVERVRNLRDGLVREPLRVFAVSDHG